MYNTLRLEYCKRKFSSVGINYTDPSSSNKPIHDDLNHSDMLYEYIVRTNCTLPDLVKILRFQTSWDPRPNKSLNPQFYEDNLTGYPLKNRIIELATSGVKPHFSELPTQINFTRNHPMDKEKLNLLLQNLAKGQLSGKTLILPIKILEQWKDVFCSPLGVVPKPGKDTRTHGRIIHNLSFPESNSINDLTVQKSLPRPEYKHCSVIVDHILNLKDVFPKESLEMMAGDVANAFRHVSINENYVKYFAGTVPELNILVIELSLTFGWTGSPCEYDVFGGAINYLHEKQQLAHARRTNTNPNKPGINDIFAYYWVDDYINVERSLRKRTTPCRESLRQAMIHILGPDACNEDKFTAWGSKVKVLGLHFDTENFTISMPQPKITKAKSKLYELQSQKHLTLKCLRSLLGVLRHVGTCIRPARAFLQKLAALESVLKTKKLIKFPNWAKEDLSWWIKILESNKLNGVPMALFRRVIPPSITIISDASDYGICALLVEQKRYITIQFNELELSKVEEFKNNHSNHFDINFRELSATLYATLVWYHRWHQQWISVQTHRENTPHLKYLPIHIQFHIDNTSAVTWTYKLQSKNPLAQNVTKSLALFEICFPFRFSSVHIPGKLNELADAGSRLSMSQKYADIFSNISLHWTQDTVPDSFRNTHTVWQVLSECNLSQQALTSAISHMSNIGTNGVQPSATRC